MNRLKKYFSSIMCVIIGSGALSVYAQPSRSTTRTNADHVLNTQQRTKFISHNMNSYDHISLSKQELHSIIQCTSGCTRQELELVIKRAIKIAKINNENHEETIVTANDFIEAMRYLNINVPSDLQDQLQLNNTLIGCGLTAIFAGIFLYVLSLKYHSPNATTFLVHNSGLGNDDYLLDDDCKCPSNNKYTSNDKRISYNTQNDASIVTPSHIATPHKSDYKCHSDKKYTQNDKNTSCNPQNDTPVVTSQHTTISPKKYHCQCSKTVTISTSRKTFQKHCRLHPRPLYKRETPL